MAYTYPTANDFKNYFVRDFPYGTDPNTSILDSDIEKAQGEAKFNFNSALAPDQDAFSMLFNYLTAHYLCIDLRAASQGISGQYEWVVTSKSVGSVSEGLQVPERIMANPEFAMLSKTTYGGKYLQLILPKLSGQIFIARGSTRP